MTTCGNGKKRKRGALPKEDLTGHTFGELTALYPTEQRSGSSVVWACRCSCGKLVYVSRPHLLSGITKSCGHAKLVDLRGKRSGRLVGVKMMKQRYAGFVMWLCKCDCGSVFLLSSSGLKYNRVKSCGCLGKKQNARCPGCGRYFPITLDGTPTPQFCPDCAPKYAGRNWRVCPVCHKLFPSPPSSNAITCSAACSSVWKSLTHKGLRVNWSDESRQRLSAKGKTENLKLGTAAAQRAPIAGRFETNQNAKIWTLVDPCGNKITVRNLILWARENTDLFGKPEGDHSAHQIASGFQAIALTMCGKRKTPAMSYFGWTLKCPPEPAE